MANTVYGPFTAINVVSGSTPANATWGNNAQTQASVAMNGINPDLSGPFVLSGITCTKDGVTANQLDIASGTAYVKLSDGTTGKIAVGADNTHTTSTPSTTYYLFLKNDGTWQWGTTSIGATNSLPICQATTDGSGNILVVTDVRTGGNSSGPGFPLEVARVVDAHITSTATATPLDYILKVTGFYRVSLYITKLNVTSNKVTATVSWNDVHRGATVSANFVTQTSGGLQLLNGSTNTSEGGPLQYACLPITMWAQSGSGLDVFVQYTDPTGTVNDYLTAVLERLV